MDREGRKKLIFMGWAAELSIHYPFVYKVYNCKHNILDKT